MKHVRISFVVVVLVVLSHPSATLGETAEENYLLYCAQCHGTEGKGGGINETAGGLGVSPRDHTNAREMNKLTDEELRLSVAEGGDAVQKSALMPPWEGTLSKKEIDALVVYLRKLCKCEGI